MKLRKIIKHTLRNTTHSKVMRFRFTMQYQSFRWHRKWRRLTRVQSLLLTESVRKGSQSSRFLRLTILGDMKQGHVAAILS